MAGRRLSGLSTSYAPVGGAITLVVFQMLGGITDFYRLARVRAEPVLLLQN